MDSRNDDLGLPTAYALCGSYEHPDFPKVKRVQDVKGLVTAHHGAYTEVYGVEPEPVMIEGPQYGMLAAGAKECQTRGVSPWLAFHYAYTSWEYDHSAGTRKKRAKPTFHSVLSAGFIVRFRSPIRQHRVQCTPATGFERSLHLHEEFRLQILTLIRSLTATSHSVGRIQQAIDSCVPPNYLQDLKASIVRTRIYRFAKDEVGISKGQWVWT